MKKVKTALISVYNKSGIEPLLQALHKHQVRLYSTGGTQTFIESLGIPVFSVESVTGYPSILGGRVKTLHPSVFGGILGRRHLHEDIEQMEDYNIPPIDLVVVDLYPFEDTLMQTNDDAEIIEKIDIGGVSLLRAAAKNHQDVAVVAHMSSYQQVCDWLMDQQGALSDEQRLWLASSAFATTSHYDSKIFAYFSQKSSHDAFRESHQPAQTLRYGENPHQKARFHGSLSELLTQLHGKELSYNNLVDLDAALALVYEFSDPVFAIVKHTNACGLAVDDSATSAYRKAFAADPVSAFGGVLATNRTITLETAEVIHELFFELLAAPDFEAEALKLLQTKKNRMLLKINGFKPGKKMFKTILNGVIEQDQDALLSHENEWKVVSQREPSKREGEDLLFAEKAVKHLKSNAIALVKGRQLLSMGCGQTSRVDALNQAISKAKQFGMDLNGAVMASDAFFPFPDCVEIAHQAGISAVIHPGGSVRDQDSIDFCNKNQMAMVITGLRHFRH